MSSTTECCKIETHLSIIIMKIRAGKNRHIGGLRQNCSNSSVLPTKLLQCCTKLSISGLHFFFKLPPSKNEIRCSYRWLDMCTTKRYETWFLCMLLWGKIFHFTVQITHLPILFPRPYLALSLNYFLLLEHPIAHNLQVDLDCHSLWEKSSLKYYV